MTRSRKSSTQTKTNHNSYGALEDRRMLAVFIVDTIADTNTDTTDGLISLREAVQAANTNTAFGDAAAGDADGDFIRFSAALAGQTITLSLGQIDISDNVFVQGGASNISISGTGNNRFFSVNTSELVAFSNLTFTGGLATTGGAISSVGTGTTLISGATFTNNRASGLGGGAVYNANGNMFLISSTFANNSATSATGSGGAAYMASGLIYTNGSTFTSNFANQSGGAIQAVNGSFFAIDIQVGTSGLGNAAGPTSSANPGDGGGLHASGTATVTISGGEFIDNQAAQNGGGLWIGSEASLFLRAAALVEGNEATGAIEGNGGGGVYLDGGAMYVNSANIQTNFASGAEASGGGIFVNGGIARLNNSTVDANATRRSGGGIYVSEGFLLLNSTDVTANDVGTTYTSTTGYGGGIYVDGTTNVVVNDGNVANNTALTEGGGIWAGADSQLFLRNTANISFNRLSSANSSGGGIYTGGYLQALDSFFQLNESETQGGGLFLTGSATARINNNNFTRNVTGNLGAGIYNNGFMFVTNSIFNGNVAGVNGGAFFSSAAATTLKANLTFSGNLPNNNN